MRSVRSTSALVVSVAAAWCCDAEAQAGGSNPIQAENARPGTTDWLIPDPNRHGISGYVNNTSYAPGATVRLFVGTGGAPFTYRVFRVGYYANAGGRLVLPTTTVLTNPGQPDPTVVDDRSDGAKLLLSGWHESSRFAIGDDWVSGVYVVRLRNANSGAESYAIFVVRATDPGAIVAVMPTNTWQAYNLWGGLSLYRDRRPHRNGIALTRGHSVSFLRPYKQGHGTGFFFSSERPLVHWLEQSGYPVSYATDRDVHFRRAVGARTKLVLLSGHPEYQSWQERAVYQGLRNRGISLAILGGNSFVTQARISSSGQVETVWRHRYLDPVKGSHATIRWELTGQAQNALTGTMDGAGGIGPLAAQGVNHWAWRGAGVANGRQIGPVRGNEQDGIVLNHSTPPTLEVLARAKGKNKLGHDRVADVTIVPGPGGTFVFNASQNWFPFHLAYPPYPGVDDPGDWVGKPYPHSSEVNPVMRRLTGNLIQRATGAVNQEPARPPRFRTLPYLSVRTPGPLHPVPIRHPIVVVWSGAPPGTLRVRIALDGRVVGVVSSARTTWTIPGVSSLGVHILRLTAVGQRGRVWQRTRRTFPGVVPNHPVFTVPSPYGSLWRAWG
jgi:N,N-dimethylformamidase beta subunit-like, C-terminal